jgi:hypothetical protein
MGSKYISQLNILTSSHNDDLCLSRVPANLSLITSDPDVYMETECKTWAFHTISMLLITREEATALKNSFMHYTLPAASGCGPTLFEDASDTIFHSSLVF